MKPSVGDSCLVTGLPLITFHYFEELIWEAFRWGQLLSNLVTFDDFSVLLGAILGSLRRGQLLSNRIAVDDLSLLLGVTLGSLPLGTDA